VCNLREEIISAINLRDRRQVNINDCKSQKLSRRSSAHIQYSAQTHERSRRNQMTLFFARYVASGKFTFIQLLPDSEKKVGITLNFKSFASFSSIYSLV
jgi:hypothetical protein